MTITEVTTSKQEQGLTKTVLRGYCKNPLQSTNLDTTTLYYLEKQGLSHYWVSRFPSGKRSHMGVYQKDRFVIEREETIVLKPNESKDNVENNDKQTVDFINELSIEGSLPKSDDLVRCVSFDEKELKWGTIYKANLVRDNSGKNLCEPFKTYYIQRKSKGSPYYNEHTCHFYEDEQLQKARGCYSLSSFSDFVEVGPVPVQEISKVKSTKIKEISPAEDEKTVNILPSEVIEETIQIPENTATKQFEDAPVPVLEHLTNEQQLESNEVQAEAPINTDLSYVELDERADVVENKAFAEVKKEMKKEEKDIQMSLFDF